MDNVKSHPAYEVIADILAGTFGDNSLNMEEDQDRHMVAYAILCGLYDQNFFVGWRVSDDG